MDASTPKPKQGSFSNADRKLEAKHRRAVQRLEWLQELQDQRDIKKLAAQWDTLESTFSNVKMELEELDGLKLFQSKKERNVPPRISLEDLWDMSKVRTQNQSKAPSSGLTPFLSTTRTSHGFSEGCKPLDPRCTRHINAKVPSVTTLVTTTRPMKRGVDGLPKSSQTGAPVPEFTFACLLSTAKPTRSLPKKQIQTLTSTYAPPKPAPQPQVYVLPVFPHHYQSPAQPPAAMSPLQDASFPAVTYTRDPSWSPMSINENQCPSIYSTHNTPLRLSKGHKSSPNTVSKTSIFSVFKDASVPAQVKRKGRGASIASVLRERTLASINTMVSEVGTAPPS